MKITKKLFINQYYKKKFFLLSNISFYKPEKKFDVIYLKTSTFCVPIPRQFFLSQDDKRLLKKIPPLKPYLPTYTQYISLQIVDNCKFSPRKEKFTYFYNRRVNPFEVKLESSLFKTFSYFYDLTLKHLKLLEWPGSTSSPFYMSILHKKKNKLLERCTFFHICLNSDGLLAKFFKPEINLLTKKKKKNFVYPTENSVSLAYFAKNLILKQIFYESKNFKYKFSELELKIFKLAKIDPQNTFFDWNLRRLNIIQVLKNVGYNNAKSVSLYLDRLYRKRVLSLYKNSLFYVQSFVELKFYVMKILNFFTPFKLHYFLQEKMYTYIDFFFTFDYISSFTYKPYVCVSYYNMLIGLCDYDVKRNFFKLFEFFFPLFFFPQNLFLFRYNLDSQNNDKLKEKEILPPFCLLFYFFTSPEQELFNKTMANSLFEFYPQTTLNRLYTRCTYSPRLIFYITGEFFCSNFYHEKSLFYLPEIFEKPISFLKKLIEDPSYLIISEDSSKFEDTIYNVILQFKKVWQVRFKNLVKKDELTFFFPDIKKKPSRLKNKYLVDITNNKEFHVLMDPYKEYYYAQEELYSNQKLDSFSFFFYYKRWFKIARFGYLKPSFISTKFFFLNFFTNNILRLIKKIFFFKFLISPRYLKKKKVTHEFDLSFYNPVLSVGFNTSLITTNNKLINYLFKDSFFRKLTNTKIKLTLSDLALNPLYSKKLTNKKKILKKIKVSLKKEKKKIKNCFLQYFFIDTAFQHRLLILSMHKSIFIFTFCFLLNNFFLVNLFKYFFFLLNFLITINLSNFFNFKFVSKKKI